MDKEMEVIAEQLPYIEDRIVNDTLCYSLDGVTWIEYTKQQLTQMLLFEQRCLDNMAVYDSCH